MVANLNALIEKPSDQQDIWYPLYFSLHGALLFIKRTLGVLGHLCEVADGGREDNLPRQKRHSLHRKVERRREGRRRGPEEWRRGERLHAYIHLVRAEV